MKKFFVIVIIIAALGLALTLSLGFIITKGVNTFGPKITGTKVTLDSAFILPTGSGTLSGLFVGNPTGWSSDKAFYLGKVHVSVAPLSVLGDHIIVKDVLIDSPEFVYETKFTSSNIQDLLNNINKAIGSSPATASTTSTSTTSTPAASSSQPRKFEVKHFVLQNAKVTLGVGPAAITLPMPTLTLVDLGTQEGGITSDQLASKIMTNILSQIGSTVAHSASKLTGAVSDGVTGAVSNGIKNLFGK